jgi:uncharacterized glyoxalase superfamily protein PhnB
MYVGMVGDCAVHRGATLVEPPHDWEYCQRQAAFTVSFGHPWALDRRSATSRPNGGVAGA